MHLIITCIILLYRIPQRPIHQLFSYFPWKKPSSSKITKVNFVFRKPVGSNPLNFWKTNFSVQFLELLEYHKFSSEQLFLNLSRLPSKKICTQERWVFIGFLLRITNFYMIGLHKNVFNMLANQKTRFISSRNRKNIRKKEVKAVRKS